MFFSLTWMRCRMTVLSAAEAKMEAGESPARSRHCKEGALSMMPLHFFAEGYAKVWEGGQGIEFQVRRHA